MGKKAASEKQAKLMRIVNAIQNKDVKASDYSKPATTIAKQMDPSDVKDMVTTEDLEKLKESKKFRSKNEPNLIMCIIGTRWVVVEEDNIRKTEYI